MPPEKESVEESDRLTECLEHREVLNEQEFNTVQEQSVKDVVDRRRFLEDSLGKRLSPSTEILAAIVPEIYDGSEKVVGPEAGANTKAMVAAVDAIHEACDGGGTDPDTIFAVLEDKTEAERTLVEKLYLEKYGAKLRDEFEGEMEGAQLDKALNLLDRKDGIADRAGRIHEALLELDQWVEGRTDETCEKDIRDTLSTMNSDQIGHVAKDYETRYGVGLVKALLENGALSEATQKAVRIYLKGADRRDRDESGLDDPRCADTMNLADIALEAEDVDMFQEAFRNASPEARKTFLSKGGVERIEKAFWGADEDHALEYAQDGKLAMSTLLDAHQSWLGDNEAAIETLLAKMQDSQRSDYLQGQRLAGDAATPESLLEDDRKALEFYNVLRAALEDAGNDSEIARWEDMIARQGGSLISKLTAHRGAIYDDYLNDIIKTVEEMSENDWSRLRSSDGNRYREEIKTALGTFLDDSDVSRCMQIVEKKSSAESFDRSRAFSRRALTQIIADSSGYVDDDENSIFEAVSRMTPDEQDKYRTDVTFRLQVDERLAAVLDSGPELDAARAQLDGVLEGAAPDDGIVYRLLRQATDADVDEAAVVRDLVQEFTKHPEVREKVRNPQSAEDTEFAGRVLKALHRALDDSEFDKYAKPLLEIGHLPLSVQMELNQSWYDDNEEGFYEDVVALTELPGDWSGAEKKAERDRILQDPDFRERFLARLGETDRQITEFRLNERARILQNSEYRDTVLGSLSEEERQIAIHALDQGELRPEDRLRARVIGTGSGMEESKELLSRLEPTALVKLKGEYARKYGADIGRDILDGLDGQEAIDALRSVRRKTNDPADLFDQVRDEYYTSRDGIGKAWVDAMWDGTGYQSDESLNAFSRAMADYAARFAGMPAAEQARLMTDLQQHIDLFRESKGALADGLSDASVAIGSIAGGFITNGGTLVLLKGLIAGGIFKAGTKAAIVGADYDGATAVADLATGGVDAAVNLASLGGSAVLFKMGESAGTNAAKALVQNAVNEGGERLVRAGEGEALERSMVQLIRESIENRSYEISDAGLDGLVARFAREGALDGDKEALRHHVLGSLDTALREESDKLIKTTGQQYLLSLQAGAAAGAASGSVRGFADWDSNKDFADNMAMVGKNAAAWAAMAGGGAVAGTTVFKVGGNAFQAVRERYVLKPGEQLPPEALDELAGMTGSEDAAARYNEQGDIEITVPSEGTAAVDALEFQGSLQKIVHEPVGPEVIVASEKPLEVLAGQRVKVMKGGKVLVNEGGYAEVADGGSAVVYRGGWAEIRDGGTALVAAGGECTVFRGGRAKLSAGARASVEAGGAVDVKLAGFARIHDGGYGFVRTGGLVEVLEGGRAYVHAGGTAIVRKGGIANAHDSGKVLVLRGGTAQVHHLGLAQVYDGGTAEVLDGGLVQLLDGGRAVMFRGYRDLECESGEFAGAIEATLTPEGIRSFMHMDGAVQGYSPQGPPPLETDLILRGMRDSVGNHRQVRVFDGGEVTVRENGSALVYSGGRAEVLRGGRVEVLGSGYAEIFDGGMAYAVNGAEVAVMDGGVARVLQHGHAVVHKGGTAEVLAAGRIKVMSGGEAVVHDTGMAEILNGGRAVVTKGGLATVHEGALVMPVDGARIFDEVGELLTLTGGAGAPYGKWLVYEKGRLVAAGD